MSCTVGSGGTSGTDRSIGYVYDLRGRRLTRDVAIHQVKIGAGLLTARLAALPAALAGALAAMKLYYWYEKYS